MSVDPASLLLPGGWEHRHVAANGSRFHVALAGPDTDRAPLVVLLHGFPQIWYAWRHQIPALAQAGYRVAAMDLRGYGTSDKPPRGHDAESMAADVSGVIRSLGASEAVVIGQGYGGQIAWSMPSLAPEVTRAVAALASPHPLALRAVRRGWLPAPTLMRLARLQVPWFPERRLQLDGVERLLSAWGAPGWQPEGEAARVYREAFRLPFSAHHVLEQLRWQVRSTPRPDGQRYLSALRAGSAVPVLGLHGREDGCLPASSRWHDRAYVRGPYRHHTVPGAGHFLAEEAPEQVNERLLAWLGELDSRR